MCIWHVLQRIHLITIRFYTILFFFFFFFYRVLVSNFTEDQLDRYEMYRRAAFPKAAIKRVPILLFAKENNSLKEIYIHIYTLYLNNLYFHLDYANDNGLFSVSKCCNSYVRNCQSICWWNCGRRYKFLFPLVKYTVLKQQKDCWSILLLFL